MIRQTTALALLAAGICLGQVTLPEGTKIRVRTGQSISSATAQVGGLVDFTVLDEVTQNGTVVIAQGATALGTILEAQPKRRMGRSGKLDFTLERVRAVDDRYIPLRAAKVSQSGKGKGVTSGLLTAGLGAVFLPAAPLGLLMKGKDVVVPSGTIFYVYTDSSFTVNPSRAEARPENASSVPVAPPLQTTVTAERHSSSHAAGSVKISSSPSGAEIFVDGAFVGNAPAALSLQEGTHRVEVRQGDRSWQRNLQVIAGSQVNLQANLELIQNTQSTESFASRK